MKKALPVLIFSLAGLLLSTNIASADSYNELNGENPCVFTLHNLKNHGFSTQRAYTGQQIHQLLNSIDVDTRNVDTIVPGQSYQLAYSCYVDHHLARATLQAVPASGATRIVSNIFWSATKPAP